jgi:hypothetical protein
VDESRERAERMLTLGAVVAVTHLTNSPRSRCQLKELSSRYAVPVVVINQVTDLFPAAAAAFPHLRRWSVQSSGKTVSPALVAQCSSFASLNVPGPCVGRLRQHKDNVITKPKVRWRFAPAALSAWHGVGRAVATR